MNNNKDKVNVSYEGNLFSTLQLIFLTLKLAGLVDWSWWFVFTPFFASVVVALLIILFVYIFTKK